MCPEPSPGLTNRTYALVLTIIFPIYVAVGLGLFVYYRSSSVLLRKRPLVYLLIMLSGSIVCWSTTVLYTYLGPDAFPCWLSTMLFYFVAPLLMSPLILKDTRYLSEVAAIKLGREIYMQRKESLRSQTSNLGIDVEFEAVRANSSCENFAAHLRIFFRLKRHKEDRLKNVQFTQSWGFLVFWMSNLCMPFILAFLIRLITEPVWINNCYGCTMFLVDQEILMIYFISGGLVGNSMHARRVSSKDALLITRETQLCWQLGVSSILVFGLFIGDPGNLYTERIFDWRSINIIPAAMIVYVQTYHQVLISRLRAQAILSTEGIAREDRFADVVSNKDLKQALKNHLDSELSSEIYLFLDSVDSFRMTVERNKDLRYKRAKRIMETFIDHRGEFEVNLSHDVHEHLTQRFAKCSDSQCDIDLFDEAYEQIKDSLLNDGFTRFVSKITPKHKKDRPLAPFAAGEERQSHSFHSQPEVSPFSH
jgi:hypothetical protein